MNLSKLFETQAKLDAHIVEKKGLQGQDLLDKKILALQVELGELANEWRGFKFWSEDQEPRTIICPECKGSGHVDYVEIGCPVCRGTGQRDRNPLLEEYVDCLHFILSIGNDLRKNKIIPRDISRTDLTFAFNELFQVAGSLTNVQNRETEYPWLIHEFINLGEMLGFTWEQIEQAYFEKKQD